MLKIVSQRKIKENWKKYRPYLEMAFESLSKEHQFTDEEREQLYKGVYERLMNPFSNTMHLWIEGDEDYLVLTQLQTDEFTGRSTLVLYSSTRTKDVDKDTVSKRYY